jgi:hypothetical protein
MDYPLAIFAPDIGARSETFIQRHIQDLLPGRAVAVGYVGRECGSMDWQAKGPLLDLDSIHQKPRMRSQIARAVMKKLRLYDDGDRRMRPITDFLLKHKVQVVLGEYLDSSLPWLQVARDLNVRFFGHAHGYDTSALLRDPSWRSEYLRYNQADGIIQ